MVRKKLAVGLVTVLLAAPGLVACDSEDVKDVKEGTEDVGNKIEDGAKEADKQLDQADTDGQDD